MKSFIISTLVPTPVRRPRGGDWAVAVALGLGDIAARLWALRKSRPICRGQEAEAVRAYARTVSERDPGFAADLYAAAARHDSLAD